MNTGCRYFFRDESSPLMALFEGTENVWEALGKRLKEYIEKRIRPGIRGRVFEGAWLMGDDIELGEGSEVEPGALIWGPAIIGRNTQIRQGAYIRGNAVIGDRCVVGHTTELKGSVMMDGAKAGHFAYIGDSILGRDVNLGAGTKLANLKVTKGNVAVAVGGVYRDTGLRKFGAIVGDFCEIGCNSVTNPGTLIGPNCKIYPCVSLKGTLEENTIVKLRQEQKKTVIKP